MPRFGRKRIPTLIAIALAASLALPALAAAESSGVLSPELAKLARPSVQGRSLSAQAAELGVPSSGPGSLQRDGEAVAVEISFDSGALAALPALREAGAEVTASSGSYQLVNATVSPADLTAVAAVPGVTSVEAVRTPIVYGAGESQTSVAPVAYCEGGGVLSEGINQLGVVGVTQGGGAVGARETFGVRGAGVTVGVLSDSYDVATETEGGTPIPTHAAADIQNDDLPGLENGCSGQQTPVRVIEDGGEGHDEGRAMLQIVHDIAPHANLAFATALGGELNFAKNIERLAAPVSAGGAGATVIVDDVGYFEEPMYQDGPIAAAISKVTAAGVTYLSAAGNDNIFNGGGEEIASLEIPEFRNDETQYCPIPVGAGARHCLDFNPAAGEKNEDNTYGVDVEVGKPLTIAVGWAEPWYGVKADLDAYLLRVIPPEEKPKTLGETEVVAADTRGNVSGKPAAFVSWQSPNTPKAEGETEELELVVNRCYGPVCDAEASATALPRLKLVLMQNGSPVQSIEYSKSSGGDIVGPTIFGHAGSASAVAVGAAKFNLDTTAEPYSSHGPVTHYYGPVLSTTPAAKLGSPEVLQKPDVTATDCGATTFFANFYLGFWRFCGTSAAAPHAAGVIALMHQANPAKTTAQLRSALTGTTKAMSGGPNTVGSGLVQARPAIAALSPGAINDPPSALVKPVTPEPPIQPVVPPAPGGGSGGSTQQHEAIKAATDQKARPKATISRHPGKLVKSRVGRTQVKFVFKADQRGSDYECSVDKGSWSKCGATFKPRLLLGAHEVRVRAVSADGETGPAAAFKFRIKLVA